MPWDDIDDYLEGSQIFLVGLIRTAEVKGSVGVAESSLCLGDEVVD